jgi:biopolymer transport protein ExbD
MIKKKQKEPVEIPASSLADIVFLLLVFFLVTTTINVDKGIKQVLPPLEPPEVQIKPENLTKILLDPSGKIFMDNQVVTLGQMYGMVVEKLRNPKMIFSVQTTRKTKYDIYIKVLDRLKQAGAKKISIAEPVEV